MLLVAAAVVLMLALQFRDGRLDAYAFVFMATSFIVTLRAMQEPAYARRDAQRDPRGDALLRATLGAALAIAFIAHLVRPPAIHLVPPGFLARLPFLIGLMAAAVLVAAIVNAPDRGRVVRGSWALLLGVYLLMGAWVIRHSPDPGIDVFVVQRDGVEALLRGQNPYTLTFPDIYGAASAFYPPGTSIVGRLQFGFVYPPLSLLLAVPGHVLAGDFRFSQLMATAAAAALMAHARPGGRQTSLLAAALYLFHPRSFFVLEQGWTEPFVVLLLALVVCCASRWRRALPYAVGLFLASKQYMVLVLPLVPLLRRGPSSALTNRTITIKEVAVPVVVATAVMALVTAPFALWNLPAFWRDVVTFQMNQPFRDDALGFLAAFSYLTGFRAPSAIGFVAAALAIVLARRRCPATSVGFATAVAMVTFAFFAFNKQAFCNYYSLVFGAFCVALSAWDAGPRGQRTSAVGPAVWDDFFALKAIRDMSAAGAGRSASTPPRKVSGPISPPGAAEADAGEPGSRRRAK